MFCTGFSLQGRQLTAVLLKELPAGGALRLCIRKCPGRGDGVKGCRFRCPARRRGDRERVSCRDGGEGFCEEILISANAGLRASASRRREECKDFGRASRCLPGAKPKEFVKQL